MSEISTEKIVSGAARPRFLRGHQARFGRRKTDHEPRHGWYPVLFLVLCVALLDWSSKALVAAAVPLGGMVEVWAGRVALWYVRNPEMVLGLWGNLPIEARQVIAGVAAILGVLLLREIVERGHRLSEGGRRWTWLFVGLAFGGMLGNIGERLVFWSVTDFLSFRWGDIWLPPGNVADLALFLSFPLVVPVIYYELRARARRQSERGRRQALAQAPGMNPTG